MIKCKRAVRAMSILMVALLVFSPLTAYAASAEGTAATADSEMENENVGEASGDSAEESTEESTEETFGETEGETEKETRGASGNEAEETSGESEEETEEETSGESEWKSGEETESGTEDMTEEAAIESEEETGESEGETAEIEEETDEITEEATEEEVKEELECSCDAACTDESFNEECPVCAEDYRECAYKEEAAVEEHTNKDSSLEFLFQIMFDEEGYLKQLTETDKLDEHIHACTVCQENMATGEMKHCEKCMRHISFCECAELTYSLEEIIGMCDELLEWHEETNKVQQSSDGYFYALNLRQEFLGRMEQILEKADILAEESYEAYEKLEKYANYAELYRLYCLMGQERMKYSIGSNYYLFQRGLVNGINWSCDNPDSSVGNTLYCHVRSMSAGNSSERYANFTASRPINLADYESAVIEVESYSADNINDSYGCFNLGSYSIGFRAAGTYTLDLSNAVGYATPVVRGERSGSHTYNTYFSIPNIYLVPNQDATVTIQDRVGSASGELLGLSTDAARIGQSYAGSAKGSSTATGAYYTGYYYTGCTTATVAQSGTVVYRYFIPASYTVICKDYQTNASGRLLGTSSWSAAYNTTASGATKGTSTVEGTYYTGYKYTGCTTATVGIAGATVYRYFAPVSYTVNYNGNGETGGSTSSSSHTYNVTKGLTANGYTRTGHTFLGWSTSKTAISPSYSNGQQVTNLAASGTVTLYAVWRANGYTISYNGNGATGGSTSSSAHTYNATKALTANGYKRTGHTFLGWSASKTAASPSYSNGQQVTNLAASGTVTLYAVWRANAYQIAYDGNGCTEGETETSAHIYDELKALTANSYTRTGYTFLGWSRSKESMEPEYQDKEEVLNLETEEGAEATLYAVWRANAYQVAYDGNGSTEGEMDSSTYTYDKAGKLAENAYRRKSHTFLGWSRNQDDAKPEHQDKEEILNLEAEEGAAVTLYAIWQKIPSGGIQEDYLIKEKETIVPLPSMPNADSRNGNTETELEEVKYTQAVLLPTYPGEIVIDVETLEKQEKTENRIFKKMDQDNAGNETQGVSGVSKRSGWKEVAVGTASAGTFLFLFLFLLRSYAYLYGCNADGTEKRIGRVRIKRDKDMLRINLTEAMLRRNETHTYMIKFNAEINLLEKRETVCIRYPAGEIYAKMEHKIAFSIK